ENEHEQDEQKAEHHTSRTHAHANSSTEGARTQPPPRAREPRRERCRIIPEGETDDNSHRPAPAPRGDRGDWTARANRLPHSVLVQGGSERPVEEELHAGAGRIV